MTLMQSLISYGASPLSFTFRTSATSGTTATSTWTPPAAAEIGDLEILFHFGWDNDSEFLDNTNIPAGVGFTSLYTNTGSVDGSTTNYLSIIVTRRVLTDKNAQTFVNPGLDARGFTGVYFQPSKAINSFTMSSPVNFQSTAGNPTAQTVTASSGNAPLIVFGMAQSQTAAGISFTTASPAFDGTAGVVIATLESTLVGWKIYNTLPVNHSIDIGDNGSNMLGSFYLSMT